MTFVWIPIVLVMLVVIGLRFLLALPHMRQAQTEGKR